MTYIEGANPISNTDSVIDSRDVIARIAYLTAEWEDATENTASDYALSEDDWKAGLDDDEAAEVVALLALQEEGEGYISDWEYGETLIHEDYFVEYMQEFLADCGDIPSNLPNYIVIDWEETADNLKVDYTEYTFGGETYLAR